MSASGCGNGVLEGRARIIGTSPPIERISVNDRRGELV
jgi:hypothetical protein